MEGYNIQKLLSTRLVLIIFLATLLGTSFSFLMQPHPVAAANPTATWTSNANPAKMAFNGKVFTQSSVSGTNTTKMVLTAPGACSSSPDRIEIGLLIGNTTINKDYHTATQAQGYTIPANCQFSGSPVTIDMTNTYNALGSNTTSPGTDQATWIDSLTIKDLTSGITYGGDQSKVKIDSTGNVMTLTAAGTKPASDCTAPILTVGDSTNGYQSAKTGTLTISRFVENPNTPNGSCTITHPTVSIAAPYVTSGAVSTAHWNATVGDPNAAIIIDAVGGDATGYLRAGDTYLESGNNPINGSDMTLLFPISSDGKSPQTSNRKSCNGTPDNAMHVNPYASATTLTITAYNPQCQQKTLFVSLASSYDNRATTPNGNSTTVTDSCNVPSESFRWFECPLITSLQGVASALNGLIASQLTIPDSIFFNPTTQAVYNIFRNIGVGLLVVAGLVMVVSQAADLEIFAAHTVRKALPRIIIIAIFISVSWPLLKFTIDFFNDLGNWSGKVILSVTDATHIEQNATGQVLANAGDALILSLVAVGGITLLGAGGIISLLFSMILFLSVGESVIMIREVIVFLFIFATPFAGATFAIEGTRKIGEFWKDTFVTAMVMFPIISMFLASGTALSYIILSVKSNDYGYHILAFAVFIAPYMALPFAFKLAGGLVGRVVEFAQGTHNQTIEGRLQSYRQNTMAKNWNATRAGSRWNPDAGATRWLGGNIVNRTGRHIGAGMRGRFGFGARGQAAISNNAALTADAASKMDHNFAAQLNNEDAMAAIAFGNNRSQLERLAHFRGPQNRARLDAALAAGRTVQATQQMQIAAADALARSGKVLDNREELDALLDNISHGNGAIYGAVKGSYQYTSRQVGRADLGRDDFDEAFRELDMSSLARQKPKALENLFGDGSRTASGDPPIVEAIRAAQGQQRTATTAEARARYGAQAQHYADLLYAAQNSPSFSPEQQGFISRGQPQVDPTLWAQARLNYSNKFPSGPAGGPGGGPTSGGPAPSDMRLKQDILHLYTRPDGIKLYRFRYIWGGPRYIGVMAQDILESHPEAVSVDSQGYYLVHYDMLRITMLELEN